MSHRPLILISNDDGIHAPGIQALANTIEDIADIVVVAPERERSAVSHCISLHKPLRLQEVAPKRYSCSGTPTDCVYIAMHHILDRKPDLVISGINAGANLGDDVTYSGTVAAAMEALLMEAPAIAFSLCARHGFDEAAKIARALCLKALDSGIPAGTLVNVNFPKGVTEDTPWKLTSLGRRNYGREVTKKLDPRGKAYYWIGGSHLSFDDIPGSDCNAIEDGFVSITPVHLKLTAQEAMDDLSSWC